MLELAGVVLILGGFFLPPLLGKPELPPLWERLRWGVAALGFLLLLIGQVL